MKTQILNYLINHRDDYTTGQVLSSLFGVSRQSIWKHIQTLNESGYTVESAHRKGYKLLLEDGLSKGTIAVLANDSALFEAGQFFDTIESTNLYLKQHATSLSQSIVVSDEQTKGRGRLGRAWSSKKGEGLWFSMLLRPDIAPTSASMLTQVAALAMHRAIHDITQLQTMIKWPNDIYYGDKKLCGILTEMVSEMGAIQHVIIGIGVNVNHRVFEDEINQIATSLALSTGKEVSRHALLNAFTRHFETLYCNFLQVGDLSFLIDELNLYSCVVNCPIWVITQSEKTMVDALFINARGELEVVDKEGQQQSLYYGEVSIRKQ